MQTSYTRKSYFVLRKWCDLPCASSVKSLYLCGRIVTQQPCCCVREWHWLCRHSMWCLAPVMVGIEVKTMDFHPVISWLSPASPDAFLYNFLFLFLFLFRIWTVYWMDWHANLELREYYMTNTDIFFAWVLDCCHINLEIITGSYNSR